MWALPQVKSLNDRLLEAVQESQQLRLDALQKDNITLQSTEELKRQNTSLEKDLVAARDEIKRLTREVNSLEEKLAAITEEVMTVEEL